MATFDSTQAITLLGKTVSVVERSAEFTTEATGVVMAVIVTVPGCPLSTSRYLSGLNTSPWTNLW